MLVDIVTATLADWRRQVEGRRPGASAGGERVAQGSGVRQVGSPAV